jgi:hypothetical protein
VSERHSENGTWLQLRVPPALLKAYEPYLMDPGISLPGAADGFGGATTDMFAATALPTAPPTALLAEGVVDAG